MNYICFCTMRVVFDNFLGLFGKFDNLFSGFSNDLILRSQELLENHPLNQKRMAEGKDPANSIWPWSPGYRPKMERLSDKFEVFTVDCKYAKIKGSDMLNDATVKGTSCNPVGQADFLAQNNTDLNISFGLCVGHDILFNMKSKVPTTTLVVKDREHKHNPYQEFVK